jgi:hypothetical protein
MSLSEMLPSLHALPRAEKWRLIQLMIADLAHEENAILIEDGQPYPVWSPHDAFEAAGTLLKSLAEEEGG